MNARDRALTRKERKRAVAICACVPLHASFQYRTDIVKYSLRVFLQFTFPDRDYAPAVASQFRGLTFIPFNCVVKLGLPEVRSCTGCSCIRAIGMPVPIATMYKYNCTVFFENQVGAARQLRFMQPETIAGPMKQGSELKFRLGVCPSNTGHVPASMLF